MLGLGLCEAKSCYYFLLIISSKSKKFSTQQYFVKLLSEQKELNRIEMIIKRLDSQSNLSSSYENSIRLWDVKTGQQKAKLDGQAIMVYSVCFSPDGTTLASGSFQKIRLWDVKTGQQKAKLDGHSSSVYSVCFSPDGTTLASGSEDNSIRLWDVKTRINQL